MKRIAVVVPCYNEAQNLPHFYNEINKEFLNLPNYDFKILFVNDGSKDNTLEIIKKLSENKNVEFLDFSRNFGKEAATSAGINNSLEAEAIIMIDADLQHPICKLKEFIEKWENGAEVVVGLRSKNEKAGFTKNFGSKIFYKIMNSIGETEITPNATDFRLIDKKVAEEFSRLTEHNRMTRGLIDWMGFKRDYVEFTANGRFAGQASYSFAKLLKLALTSFVSHSLLPLKFAGYLGILTILSSGILGVFIILEKYIFHDPFNFKISAITQLAVLIVFLIGIILSCLGLIALYIAHISADTQKRPLYIVRERK